MKASCWAGYPWQTPQFCQQGFGSIVWSVCTQFLSVCIQLQMIFCFTAVISLIVCYFHISPISELMIWPHRIGMNEALRLVAGWRSHNGNQWESFSNFVLKFRDVFSSMFIFSLGPLFFNQSTLKLFCTLALCFKCPFVFLQFLLTHMKSLDVVGDLGGHILKWT